MRKRYSSCVLVYMHTIQEKDKRGGKNAKVKKNPFLNWDETAQYWFGYLAADGNLSKTKYSINLLSIDHSHLSKFKDWVEPSLTLYNKKGSNCKVVTFGHFDTYQFLITKGITPKKSLTLNLNTPITRHILRGVFDGDGCYSSRCSPKITSGSLMFLRQLSEFLTQNGIDVTIKIQCIGINTTYALYVKMKHRFELYKLLYDNSTIFLERKELKLRSSLAKVKDKSDELQERLKLQTCSQATDTSVEGSTTT